MKKFLTSKGPILALLVVALYGILVFLIYFEGYDAMPNHMDEMPISIVNQDSKSDKLASQIEDQLDFKHIKKTNDLSKAKSDLKSRKTYLIINIPKNFTRDVQQNKSTELNFYVNDSNSYSGVSAMKNVATAVGGSVNKQVIVEKGKSMLTKAQLSVLQQNVDAQKAQLATQPAAVQQQAEAKVQAQEAQINQNTNTAYKGVGNSVKTNIHQVNKAKSGLNIALAPFFANLAVYIGSMLGMLLLYGTYVKFSKQVGRGRSFAMLEVTMLILSVIGAAVVSAVIAPMMGLSGNGFMQLWLNHGLEIFAAYNFNAILVLLLGQMGTVLNIFLTMIQVVSGAGMVPLVTMNGFYKFAHVISPMYYSVQADFNIMFGGNNTSSFWWGIVILTLCIIVVNIGIVSLRKKPTMINFEDLS
jgi:uncharacterized phage infection (PIP) family protein YhgE